MAQLITDQREAQRQASQDRIRVLQLVPEFCIGGAESMAVNLACCLDSARFEVMAVAFREQYTRLEDTLIESGIRFLTLGRRHKIDPSPALRLSRLIRRFKPDILHTHLGVLQYALPELVAGGVRAAVHTVHKVADRENRLSRWLFRTAFRFGLQPISISREVSASLRRVYGIQSTPFIANGIPLKQYRISGDAGKLWRIAHGFAEGDFLFLCVAGLREVKNHALLIDAFAQISSATRAKLVFLGDGPLKAALMERVSCAGLTGKIHFLSESDAVAAALAAADVFVLGSTSEAHPLSVMEAMAAGLPCICTAVGGVLDLIVPGVNGILTPNGDYAAMSAAMVDLLVRPNKRLQLGRRAAATATSEFGLERMITAYSELYETIVHKARTVSDSL